MRVCSSTSCSMVCFRWVLVCLGALLGLLSGSTVRSEVLVGCMIRYVPSCHPGCRQLTNWQMLHSLMRAPLNFFEMTPSGRSVPFTHPPHLCALMFLAPGFLTSSREIHTSWIRSLAVSFKLSSEPLLSVSLSSWLSARASRRSCL